MVRKSKHEEIRRQYRRWRIDSDMSQLDAAVEAGMTREKYWRIENGYDQPTAEEITKLARAFGVPSDTLRAQVSEQAAR